MQFSTAEQARLRAARTAFLRKMDALGSEAHQRSHLEAVASEAVIEFVTDTGTRRRSEVDPYYRSLARQTLDGFRYRDSIASAQAQIAEIEKLDPSERRPRDPHFYGAEMARKAALERQIQDDVAAFERLKSEPLVVAQREAVGAYRSADAAQASNAQRREALARADAKAEQSEVDDWAESLARPASVSRMRFGGIENS